MNERRVAQRVVPKKKLKGRLEVESAGRWVQAKAVMDVSPFGIRVHLADDIRKSGDVVLRLEIGDERIEVGGRVAWLMAGAGKECKAGIELLPENIQDNTRLFEAIIRR